MRVISSFSRVKAFVEMRKVQKSFKNSKMFVLFLLHLTALSTALLWKAPLSSPCLVDYLRYEDGKGDFVSLKLDPKMTDTFKKLTGQKFADSTVELVVRNKMGRRFRSWLLEMANGESVFVVDVPETNYRRVGRSLRKSSKFAKTDHDAFVVLPQTSHILKLDSSGKFEGVSDSRLMTECGLSMCNGPLRGVDVLDDGAADLREWFRFRSRVRGARSSLEIGCNPRFKLVLPGLRCGQWTLYTRLDDQRKLVVLGREVQGRENYLYYNPGQARLMLKEMPPTLHQFDGRTFYFYHSVASGSNFIRHVDTGMFIRIENWQVTLTCDERIASDIMLSTW